MNGSYQIGQLTGQRRHRYAAATLRAPLSPPSRGESGSHFLADAPAATYTTTWRNGSRVGSNHRRGSSDL